MRASAEFGGRSLSQYSQFGRSCSAMVVSRLLGRLDHCKSNAELECRISLDSGHRPPFYRANSLSGSLELSFNRSSTLDDRTWATLWCGISTLLTMSDRLLRSRSTALSR